MMSKNLCIFGEVLFEIFPDGHKVLGGAPFNVAWHLQAFGQAPFFISRVGNDPEGSLIRKTMMDWGMDTFALQTHDKLPTGKVNIQLTNGEPQYDIVEPSAYDNINTDNINNIVLEENCQFLYHGSLALRSHQSKKALQQVLQTNPELVFVDVNLRAPWWNKASLLKMLESAHWVKLNSEELNLLYPSNQEMESRITDFIAEYDLQGVVLTHGKNGAEMFTAEQQHYSTIPDEDLQVIDTVGAGDAFSSVVILGLKNKWPLAETIQRAQQFASEMVKQRGATVNDPEFYNHFLNDWGPN